jgi:hypothetical protein
MGRAFSSSEPGRRPWAVPDRPKMTADVIKYRRDFLLGKLLDQPKQLLTLHAHDPSVRSKAQRAGSARRVWHAPDRTVRSYRGG